MVGQGPLPDAIPPASGSTSRRKPEDITAARKLRDDILALIEQQPRSEADLMRITGRSKGEVKAALRRLAVADLVFARETGSGTRAPALWHHWPSMIAGLRARETGRPAVRAAKRITGARIA